MAEKEKPQNIENDRKLDGFLPIRKSDFFHHFSRSNKNPRVLKEEKVGIPLNPIKDIVWL